MRDEKMIGVIANEMNRLGYGHHETHAESILCAINKARSTEKSALQFADKVIGKLQRFYSCAEDGQDTDIGRHWLDLLTQLGLLNRVQRSPARWEITQQGEDALESVRAKP